MNQREIEAIIKRIEDLVIEAAYMGASEDEIMNAVNDGLDIMFPLSKSESDENDE